MSIHHDQPVEANFDPVARIYRWAEYLALGPLLQQTRSAHLDRLITCRNILLFGDGDGRFLARLLAQNTEAHATAVDTSAAMLNLLRKRCDQVSTAASGLTTQQASALNAPVPLNTDLVVTHFFLDCLTQTEVDQLLARITTAVRPGTLWLLSDFAVPMNTLRPFAKLYIHALYFAFRMFTGLHVTSLPDPQSSLQRSGFRLLARKCKLFGILYSELWVFEPA